MPTRQPGEPPILQGEFLDAVTIPKSCQHCRLLLAQEPWWRVLEAQRATARHPQSSGLQQARKLEEELRWEAAGQ